MTFPQDRRITKSMRARLWTHEIRSRCNPDPVWNQRRCNGLVDGSAPIQQHRRARYFKLGENNYRTEPESSKRDEEDRGAEKPRRAGDEVVLRWYRGCTLNGASESSTGKACVMARRSRRCNLFFYFYLFTSTSSVRPPVRGARSSERPYVIARRNTSKNGVNSPLSASPSTRRDLPRIRLLQPWTSHKRSAEGLSLLISRSTLAILRYTFCRPSVPRILWKTLLREHPLRASPLVDLELFGSPRAAPSHPRGGCFIEKLLDY